jgi:Divergent InlB B-repeat domain
LQSKVSPLSIVHSKTLFKARRGGGVLRQGRAARTGEVAFFLAVSITVLLGLATVAQAAPANDDFVDASVFSSGLPGEDFSSNEEATKEAGEPNHAGNAGGHSLWYSWTPSSSGSVRIHTCTFGELDSLLAVYTGSAVNSLTPVASNDDGTISNCDDTDSEVSFTATAGTTYSIAVDGKDGDMGFFELFLHGPPENDDFENAEEIGASLPEFASVSTILATKQAGEPNHAGNAGGHSVWFTWTPSSSGPVEMSTCAFNGLDTLLAVYTGSAMNALTPVASNDDSSECFSGGGSVVSFTATAGTTYRIAVDGKNGAYGSFGLELEGPPANDDFSSPQALGSSLPEVAFGSNKLASKQAGEPNHAGNSGGHSVWYSWTPSSTTPVSISTCTGGPDTLLAVYIGSAVNSLTPVASNDDGPGCGGGSEVQFIATAGTTYRIAVDGKNGTRGSTQLILTGPPANDSFSNPQTIGGGLPNSGFGSNKLATKQAGEPNHAGNSGGHSVWYSWTPSSSGPVGISTCSFSGFDPLVAVYTGSTVNALTPVASSDDAGSGCSSVDADVEFTATAGTTYRIAVDGKNGSEGSISLQLQGPPANDDFGSAQALGPELPVFTSGNNKLASKQAGEPNHAGNSGGHSVWYSWTPSSSGVVSINTCSFSSLDTLLAVYTGSAVNSLTPVASNDDVPNFPCSSRGSEVQFTATAGTTYRIAVDGKNGARGSYELRLTPPPANDDFADAQLIDPELPRSASGTTRLATKQGGEPDHAGDPGGHSVWYSWTPSSSGPVSISTCDTSFEGFDTLLAVYTGSTVNGLTPVASNDDGPSTECSFSDSEVDFTATAGTTYKIAVDGAGGGVGPFELDLVGQPLNDDFADAEALAASSSVSAFGSTRLASKQAGEPNHAGNPGGHSVWYSWTPSSSGPVEVSTCAFNGLDTLLAVYTGSGVNALTPVASNDDAISDTRESSICTENGSSEAVFNATMGTTYRIAVDGKDGSEGRFILELEGHPGNDDFAAAQSLGLASTAFSFGNTKLATKEAGEPNHAGNPGGHSVWYSWTPSSSGPVEVSTCSFSSLDTLLAVYTGSAVNGLTPVASNDDGGACDSTASALQFTATAGTTYRIAVDGKGGTEGSFELSLRSAPSNDEFAKAQSLGGTFPIFGFGSNKFATKEAGEPNHAGNSGGHSVWYSWTPSSSGAVTIDTCSFNGLDTLLAVYTGSAVNSLTPVASNDDAATGCSSSDSGLQFVATAGTSYRIAVDGKGAGQGSFTLELSGSPANDDLDDSLTLSSTFQTSASGFNKLATKEAGEPSHAGNPGGHSVWYSWTPSSSGQVEVSTCTFGGSIDTLLAVYTGSAVNSLTPVASNDDSPDGACESPTDSALQFSATAGTTYRIAIDGKAGSTGSFTISLAGRPANDDLSHARSAGGSLPSRENFATNKLATKQGSEPNHAGDPGGASVWFKWTAPHSEAVSIDTCGSSFDTLLAVYTGSAVNSLTPVASDDDGGGGCDTRSKLLFDAVGGTVYRIAVDGKGAAQGFVELSIEGAPSNDDFAAARTVPGSSSWFRSGSTRLASKQAGEPNHAGNPGGHSVWYSWTPSSSGEVTIYNCSGDFDTLLAVYTGSAVNGLTEVASSDDGDEECSAGSSLSFDAVAGTSYKIAVDGVDGDEGRFQLDLEGAGPPEYPLSVSKAGDGSGTVTSSPAGIDCGATCGHSFESGDTVTLTAAPDSSSTFAGWAGACAGSGACQVTMSQARNVTATFSAKPTEGGGGGGGGGDGGGGGAPGGSPGGQPAGGGASAGPAPPVAPQPKPKPLKCKAGFKKTKVHGKSKCVKKKPKRRHGRG